MIRLRTLGSVELRAADGTQIQSVLRQPKRLALLIYLALNEPVFHRRDRLLPLFWPESDEERARGSLSQYVFQLRQALGKDVIVSRGDDELGLATDRLWCDTAEFDDLIRSSRFNEAMEVYGGELLPGFNIDDAPEFERWLDEQRARRAQQAASACVSLSEQAELKGDLRAAVDCVRRAIVIQPLSEPLHQRLIALLDASGDRAAALAAFEELSNLLRAEFDTDPSAETLALMNSVRAREETKADALPIVRAGLAHEYAIGHGSRTLTSRFALGLIAALLVVGVGVAVVLAKRQPKPYRPPANHVAVLYFNDESATHDLAYLAEGLTSTLIDQLGQVKQLQVISRNGVRPLRGSSIPLDSVARQLDVGTLVGGSVTRSNEMLRVTVELVDGATGVVLRTKRLERPNAELFALLDDLSAEVATFLRETVGQEVKLRQWQAETKNVDAWLLLQEAEGLRTTADELESSGRVVEALAALARADSLSNRAFDLDRRFTAAAIMRGRIAEKRGLLAYVLNQPDSARQWLDAARQYAEYVFSINPESPAAYELRGATTYYYWLLLRSAAADSLLQLAEADLRQAVALSDDRPRAESTLSTVLNSEGKFAEARTAALRALEADAFLTDANNITLRLFETSFETGDDAEAGHWCDVIRRRMTGRWLADYCDLVLLGWARGATRDPRKAIHILQTFAPADPEYMRQSMLPRLTMLAAAVVAGAGMRDSANAMVSRAHAMAPNDIELLHLEAATRVVMNENDRAISLLRDYLQANPSARQHVTHQRFFQSVRGRFNAQTQTMTPLTQ